MKTHLTTEEAKTVLQKLRDGRDLATEALNEVMQNPMTKVRPNRLTMAQIEVDEFDAAIRIMEAEDVKGGDGELLPCPFCGAPAKKSPYNVVGCQPCGMWVGDHRRNDWNRRAALSAPAAPSEQAERFAKWISKHPPELPDHACAKCVPHSDILKPGWQCAYHEALEIMEKAK